jgi:general secretion pathway protein D
MKLKKAESVLAGTSASVRHGAVILVCVLLASCAASSSQPAQPATAIGPSDPPAGAAATTFPDAQPAGVAAAESANGPAPTAPDIEQEGRTIQIGRFAEAVPRVQVQGDNTIALNLEQEDLRRVLEQLGDALQLNMVIDPAIDSVVSVRTTEDNPLTYDDIWPLMRLLAREAGVTIEQAGDVYVFSEDDAVVPTEIVMPGWLGDASASEVLQVTPLRYISRETAGTILAPLVADEGSIISLGARNLIGISGPAGMLARVNALLEVIDDDPFQNQGIKLYRRQFTQAGEVAEELAEILTLILGDGGV